LHGSPLFSKRGLLLALEVLVLLFNPPLADHGLKITNELVH